MPEVRLCAVDDVKLGTARRFEVERTAIALVHCAGGFRAVDDVCSHEDYSLSEGEVYSDECEIECWKHGSTFSLETGEPLTLPATKPVAVYQVKVKDGSVILVLP